MKNRIDIFVELSERLSSGIPEQILESACIENSWFRVCDISAAVESIRTQMLDYGRLEGWMSNYPTLPVDTLHIDKAEDILIIMAGNIPLVGFFDLLCVVMAGHNAYVKCSSKDRVLMEYVISIIKNIEPSIPIYIGECSTPDRVIATGGENAVRYFKSRYIGIPTLLRGSRHSVAVIGSKNDSKNNLNDDLNDDSKNYSKDDVESFKDKIKDDIYMYSGLGCRNVSMIFIPKGDSLNIPTVDTHPQYRNNYLQNRALQTMRGVEFQDNGASTFIKSQKFPDSLSSISIYEYESLSEVEAWIEEHDDELQCIVSNIIQHPRRVNFGESQLPSLYDYADAVDTMKFLM